MKFLTWSVTILAVLGFDGRAHACINDSKTLSAEKRQHPSLAQAILSPKIEQPDVKSLTEDIRKLKSNPETNDVAWWNDLAGAYLRLGQPAEAVKILEPLTNRFAADYGIHANLGTAYHLLGRYADAEKEIRRDTEINPDGHFGLEKYHLALLQYLCRSKGYRVRHVYVAELTDPFLRCERLSFRGSEDQEVARLKENQLSDSEQREADTETFKILHQMETAALDQEGRHGLLYIAEQDDAPEYLTKWQLWNDPKLDEGVIYMATLNPKEPACQVMLGVVAMKHWDVNLARAAFEDAIQLGSPQTPILRAQLESLSRYHPSNFGALLIGLAVLLLAMIIILILVCRALGKWWAARSKLKEPWAT